MLRPASGAAARQIDHAIVTALTLKKPVYIEIACNISEEIVSKPIPFQVRFEGADLPIARHATQSPCTDAFACCLAVVQLPPHKPSNAESLKAAVAAVHDMWEKAAKPVLVVGVKVRRFARLAGSFALRGWRGA